jgi:hypothetical protein
MDEPHARKLARVVLTEGEDKNISFRTPPTSRSISNNERGGPPEKRPYKYM